MRPGGCDDLQAALGCVDALRESMSSLCRPELLDAVCGIEVLARKTHATMLELVAGLDDAGIAGEQGFRATWRGHPDPRTPAQRNADALVELCDLARGNDQMSTAGGEPPHVTVTLGYETLMKELSGATLDYGQRLSAAQARLAACDCKIIPVVLGGDGEPLDVGRAQRTVPLGIRRALVARDRGCRFPGCDRAPALCHSHHVREWHQDGHTAVENCVLLCPTHHRWVHALDGTSPSAETSSSSGHPSFSIPIAIHSPTPSGADPSQFHFGGFEYGHHPPPRQCV